MSLHPDISPSHQSEAHEQSEKQKRWNEIREHVDNLADGLGKGIDEGIKDSITALLALDINTAASCEGHLDWGTGAPYIDVDSKQEMTPDEQKKLERLEDEVWIKPLVPLWMRITHRLTGRSINMEKLEAERDQKEDELIQLQREMEEKYGGEREKVRKILAEFNDNRETDDELRLILDPFTGSGRGRIESKGARKYYELMREKKINPEEHRPQLEKFQSEMIAFTTFLKHKFFEDS